LAVARAIVRSGGLDYDGIADGHVQAFETLELRGWDATTKQACRRLSQGTPRARSGNLGGTSNTVAAKIAPVAAWSFARGEDRETLLRHCVHVGQMTHYDPRAITGAYIIAQLVRDALAAPRRWDPAADRYEQLIEETLWVEKQLERHLGASDDPMSQNLRELSDAIDAPPEEIAELSNGATSYSCHSIPFVVAFLCGRPWEFEEGVIAAVNCGGDTDTNGAIVGAVLGAAWGAKKLPKRFADGVEEAEIIRDVAAEFARVIEG
jgi:ADP-ribosyl-[dinitrogen reductase] hydrolase